MDFIKDTIKLFVEKLKLVEPLYEND